MQYPKSFIQFAKIKLSKFTNVNVLQKFKTIILQIIIHYIDISFYPTIQPQTSSKKNLNNLGIKTATNSSKIISNLLHKKDNNTYIESRVGIYGIPCPDCNKKYIGESFHSLNKEIYEHMRDLQKSNINSHFIKQFRN